MAEICLTWNHIVLSVDMWATPPPKKKNPEPPWNVASSLSHSSCTPSMTCEKQLLFPGMNSNATCISTPEAVGDALWSAVQLRASRTNLVCIYAQVTPRPWLVLLTKTWLTAWPSFWLPWCLSLLPVQWRLSTSFVLEKRIWADQASPTWAVGLVCAVTTWALRTGTMKMILIRKHSNSGL